MDTSIVQEKSQRPNVKRSISSTFKSLFRSSSDTTKSDNCGDRNSEGKKRRKLLNTVEEQNLDYSKHDSDDSIILFDPVHSTEGQRPPLLPILPRQRLKLLKYKQLKRIEQDFKELSALIKNNKESYKPDNKLKFKSLLKKTDTKPKHSYKSNKWSAMYEYDPSEFDESETLVVEEDKRQTPINFEIQKANTPLSNRLIEVPDSTKKITSAESDVLFNIPKAKKPSANGTSSNILSEKPVIKNASKLPTGLPKQENVLLPTVGFDFIKDSNETPSKTLPSKNKPQLVNIDKTTDIIDSEKPKAPLFSFGNNKTNATEKQEATIAENDKTGLAMDKPKAFSFGLNKEKPGQTLLGNTSSKFSFGTSGSLSGESDATTKADNASQTNISSKIKPLFTLNSSESNKNREEKSDDEEDERDNKGKRRSSGNDKVPSFSFGNKATSLAPESQQKPSFSFGAKPAESTSTKGTTATEKPVFSFSIPPVQSDEKKDKPIPLFGGLKATTDSGNVGNEKKDEQSQNKTKPLFNFGPKVSNDNSGSPVTNESSTKPNFSFLKPANANTNGTPADESTKTDSSAATLSLPFGAKVSKPSEDKPAISFGFGSSQSTEKQEQSKSTGTPSFTFSATKSETQPKNDAQTSTGSLFSLGSKATETAANPTTSQPTFQFGKAALKNDAASPSPSSVFGSSTGLAQSQQSKPAFSFNSAPNQVPGSGAQSSFSFGKPNASAPPTTFPASQSPTPFGQTPAPQISTPNALFNAPMGANPQPQEPAQVFKPAQTPNFNFMSGSSNINPAAVFAPSQPASVQPQQIFGGGMNSNPSMNTAGAPVSGMANPFTSGMGNGMATNAPQMGMASEQKSTPPPGFTQRRLARMRAPRR
ncbi:Hypothetical protein J6896_04238 [Nakaseomyces glabratus]